MQPEIRAKFTPAVLDRVARAVGVDAGEFRLHDAFESVVHEVVRDDESIFVKAIWSQRRTPSEVRAEMAFVRLLADAGVRVARPVSIQAEDVVTIPAEGGAFHVSATTCAPGEILAKDAIHEAHFVQWGKLLGQMHGIASQPACRDLIHERPTWEQEHGSYRPFAKDPRVLKRFDATIATIAALPREPDVFGLIHSDVHAHNVHWLGEVPTAFDFEDCMGFWYMSDVAIVLFYTLANLPGSEAIQEEFRRNLAWIRRGYEQAFQLPDSAWDTLPLFMNLRELVLFLVIERSIPPETRYERLVTAMEKRFARIIGGEGALGLRF